MIRVSKIYYIALCITLILTALIAQKYSLTDGDWRQDYHAVERYFSGVSIYQGWNDHPPMHTLIMFPLLLFSPITSYYVLTVCSVLQIIYLVWIVTREFSEKYFFPTLLLVLVSEPWRASVALGSTSVLISLLLILTWQFYLKEKNFFCSIFLSLAIYLKLYPLALGVIFLRKNNKIKNFSFFCLMLIVLGIVVVIVFGSGDIVTYFSVVLPKLRESFSDFPANESLWGMCEKIFGSSSGWTKPIIEFPLLSLYLSVLSFCAIWFYFLYCLKNKNLSNNQLFSILFINILLTAPNVWGHYYFILIMPIVWLYHSFQLDNSKRGLVILLIAVILLEGDLFLLISSFSIMNNSIFSIFKIISRPCGLLLLASLIFVERGNRYIPQNIISSGSS